MSFVEFDFDLEKGTITREQYEQLVRAMFSEQPEVMRVKLFELPGGHVGLSRLSILLAQPYGVKDSEYNLLIVRVGPKEALDQERQRYQRYVADFTGLNKAQPRRYASVDTVSAIAYDYLGREPDQRLKTLQEFLGNEERPDDLNAACRAITGLFRGTLAQGNRRNGWFHAGDTRKGQRPLWFYNTILPSTMTLQHVELVDRPSAKLALSDQLAYADGPQSSEIKDQFVFLDRSIYSRLQIVERELIDNQCRLRLFLFENDPTTSALYQPLPSIAARIDLIGPTSLYDLPNELSELDADFLQGQVIDTRYRMLQRARRDLGALLKQDHSGNIYHKDTTLPDPIACYYELLMKPRRLTTSIIHGDMNLGNILLSRSASGVDATAWLIDFDKTTPSGHAVFDAVKLETEYKVHILPHRLSGVDEFLHVEKALHQALIDPDEGMAFLGKKTHLRDAYQFISTIRQIMLKDLMTSITPVEYYLGLMAYGLAALKHRNLYADDRHRWLRPDPNINPLAIAAYLSASFAAWAIPQSESLRVRPDAYPPVRDTEQPLIKSPRLIGRDLLLAKARRQLGPETEVPVVLLYGPVGSGRSAIALSLCADLQRRGYIVWPWQSFVPVFRTIREFVEVLIPFLKDHHVQGLPSVIEPPQSKIGVASRVQDVRRLGEQLVAALQHSEMASQPFVLLVDLSHADPELRSFMTQFIQVVQRTAVILIADQRLEGMRRGVALEVTPWSLAEVQDYVRYQQLPLNKQAVERLANASYGFPGLLIRLIDDAHAYQIRANCSLQEAVLNISVHKHITDFMEEVLWQLPDLMHRLFELEALLLNSASKMPTDIEHVFMYIIEINEWSDATSAAALVAAYYEQAFHRYDGLTHMLQEYALSKLRIRSDFRKLCKQVAVFYQKQSPPDHYLAACYQILGEQWSDAATTLAAIASEPTQIFTVYCSEVYGWTQKVLQQTLDYDEVRLFELAGDCAAYLGQYSEAADYYNRLLGISSSNDFHYSRLLARLLKVYEAHGKSDNAHHVCQLLLTHTRPDDSLYALGLAHEGIALLSSQPDRAATKLRAAIDILEKARERWGTEQHFYEEERVLLYDSLARAEVMIGHVDTAIDYLLDMRTETRRLGNKLLAAKIDNNLGFIYYYVRGRDHDPELARQRFKAALEIRIKLGDRDGQVRAGQNLANVTFQLARTAEEWDQAESLFEKYEVIARDLQSADQILIIVNHIDALAERGAVERAHTLIEQVDLEDMRDKDKNTFMFLLKNLAKLALRVSDVAMFEHYLAQVMPLLQTSVHTMSQLECAQLMLEYYILFKPHPEPEPIAVKWVNEIKVPENERQPDAAECFFAQGLLAFSRGDYTTALAQLADSQRLWSGLKYHYRVAFVEYWRVLSLVRSDDIINAQASINQAMALLQPFGETPILQYLRRLENQLAKEG